ncbi:MAG: MarR family winged helix-turn-helix transcriptional regulator [Myxococcales bacterium]
MQRQLGVSGPQRLAVRIIGQFPGILGGELASILQLHPGTVTRIVERLCSNAYVKRAADLSDARKVRLSLTAKGKKLDTLRSRTVETAVRRALARLSVDQVASARAALRCIGEELAKIS